MSCFRSENPDKPVLLVVTNLQLDILHNSVFDSTVNVGANTISNAMKRIYIYNILKKQGTVTSSSKANPIAYEIRDLIE